MYDDSGGEFFLLILFGLFFISTYSLVTITKYYGIAVLVAVLGISVTLYKHGKKYQENGKTYEDKKFGKRVKWSSLYFLLAVTFSTAFMDDPSAYSFDRSRITTESYIRVEEDSKNFYFYKIEHGVEKEAILKKKHVDHLRIINAIDDSTNTFSYIPYKYNEVDPGNTLTIILSSGEKITRKTND